MPVCPKCGRPIEGQLSIDGSVEVIPCLCGAAGRARSPSGMSAGARVAHPAAELVCPKCRWVVTTWAWAVQASSTNSRVVKRRNVCIR